jgi:transposase
VPDLRHQASLHHGQGAADHPLGATQFLMKTLKRVSTEMALHVLAYNLTRVMNILGTRPLIAAMRA